jgi:hypothetical protein
MAATPSESSPPFGICGKHEGVKKQIQKAGELIAAPAYPFSPRDLFLDLRSRLADEHGSPMQFDRLAQMIGKYKSTTHAWFETYHHPHILAFMLLLERLSPEQRGAFLENHCRTYPTLFHPRLAHNSENIFILRDLLARNKGLSILTGTPSARHFVFTALGHAAKLASKKVAAVAGIDLRRPTQFVPVENLVYIDHALAPNQIRRLTLEVWPSVLVSRARVLLLNRVWSAVPSVREDILRCASSKHVFIAEEDAPDWRRVRNTMRSPIHVVTLSSAPANSQRIRVRCRLLQSGKAQ